MSEVQIVTIRQSRSFTPIPQELRNEISKRIGSKWNALTRSPLIGLNEEEQKHILPKIVRVTRDNKDEDWESKVNTYFANLTIDVPYLTGKELNIATTKKIVGKNEKGEDVYFDMPDSPIDYTMYKQAVADSDVATTPVELLHSTNYKFVLVNKTEEKNKKARLTKSFDKLDTLRLMLLVTLKDSDELKDPNKVDAVIRMFGKNPDVLSIDEKSVFLREEKDKSVKLLEDGTELEDTPFYKVVNDKDLGIKSKIAVYVQAGILEQEGTSYRDPSTDIVLGNTLDQAVNFCKNASNNGHLSKWTFAQQGVVQK